MSFLFDAAFSDPDGVPPGHEFRVYVPDDSGRVLIPAYTSPGADLGPACEVGRGATGVAWATGVRMIARGSEVGGDGALGAEGLPRRPRAVAAVPIRLPSGGTVGVLTASSSRDESFLASPEGIHMHSFLAAVAGEILSLAG